jgi:hypothetical protein
VLLAPYFLPLFYLENEKYMPDAREDRKWHIILITTA